MDDRCKAITLGGSRCTKKAVEMGCCSIQAHKKQLGLDKLKITTSIAPVPITTSVPNPVVDQTYIPNVISEGKEVVPPQGTVQRLEKNYRGVNPAASYTSLGFIPTEANKYYHPTITKYRGDKNIPYPEDFSTVATFLMDLCKTLTSSCIFHTGYPGIQWTNDSVEVGIKKEQHKAAMTNTGNHYYHNSTDNPTRIWGIDPYYCWCQEYKSEDTAFGTLLLDDNDNDKWFEYHGKISVPDTSPFRSHVENRVVSAELKKKIKQDSIVHLAQEYKIHLQPKPEYQISVIEELIKLLKLNPEFSSCIDTWKAIIPYSNVISDMKLPAVVIYPVKGEKCARYALNTIIKHFNQFNIKEIGLDITPRYNAKYNELIYWANGSGDHKKMLPEKYFTSNEKIFYVGHELYPN
jgi:hypothetical protein